MYSSRPNSRILTLCGCAAVTGTLMLAAGCTGSGPSATSEGTGQPSPGPASALVQRLAFSSERDGNREIYLVEPDRTQLRLTDDLGDDAQPAWSPDGAHVVFASDRVSRSPASGRRW